VQSSLCFVSMPHGRVHGTCSTVIDFDAVYAQVVAPAVRMTGMEPIRGPQEQTDNLISKSTLEHLLLCEVAIIDLTLVHPAVFYQLGVRCALRPRGTLCLCVEGLSIPSDLRHLDVFSYSLTAEGVPCDSALSGQQLAVRLSQANTCEAAGVLLHLADGRPVQAVEHEKTDVFRDQVQYATVWKEQLAAAREAQAVHRLQQIERALGDLATQEAGVMIDLCLSYRAVKAWEDMVRVIIQMAPSLARTALIQEQKAFALNRLGEWQRAEQILLALLEQRGPSSETCGILGRIYKDRWVAACAAGEGLQAHYWLDKAINAYVSGFEADWRDAYPGINAVTLMELRDPPDPRKQELLPVVTYALKRRIHSATPDYWDHATLLELAVLGGDEALARSAMNNAVGTLRESWEAESTLNNLRQIQEVQSRRGTAQAWLLQIIDTLERQLPP